MGIFEDSSFFEILKDDNFATESVPKGFFPKIVFPGLV